MNSGLKSRLGLVWCDYDGTCMCINTTLERQKGKNPQANPIASLLIVSTTSPGMMI